MSMHEPTDITLMAFADGELDAAEAADLERTLAQRPDLGRRVGAFRASREAAHAALAPLAEAPVPPALRAAVEARIAAARPESSARLLAFRPRPSAVRRLALPLAASLAVLLAGTGGYVAGRTGSGAGDALAVAGSLGHALNELPTGSVHALDGAGEVRLVSSFHDGTGRLCREFVRSDPSDRLTAVACHDGDGWQLRFAVATPATASYAPAGADAALESFLLGIDAGLPLDPAAEARALAGLN